MDENDLSVVDIGKICLLAKKYKNKISEAKIENIDDDDMDFFLTKCSESVSEQLSIMDKCQQILWQCDFENNDVEEMLKVKAIFEEGIVTLQSILEAFEIATSCNQNDKNP